MEKIKIKGEIEEEIDNKINNQAVELMEEKEWEQLVWEDLIEIIDKVDRQLQAEQVEVVQLKLFRNSN